MPLYNALSIPIPMSMVEYGIQYVTYAGATRPLMYPIYNQEVYDNPTL